jgi:hypothetical protein
VIGGQAQAQLLGRDHAIERFIKPRRRTQGGRSLFGLAATHLRARLPIIGRRGQFGIGRTLGRAGKGFGGIQAIVEAPGRKARRPTLLGHPCARHRGAAITDEEASAKASPS